MAKNTQEEQIYVELAKRGVLIEGTPQSNFISEPLTTGNGRRVFSFDAETNGLWGQAFALGALVYDEKGNELARFVGRLPDEQIVDGFWREPDEKTGEVKFDLIKDVPVIAGTYKELLQQFAEFYLAHKDGADVVVHMGYIVEAKILRDMREFDLIGEWDGPFPLYDVSGNLQAFGQDPTSVDSYAQKMGLEIGEFEGGTHNPLYDSAVAAKVYMHLTR